MRSFGWSDHEYSVYADHRTCTLVRFVAIVDSAPQAWPTGCLQEGVTTKYAQGSSPFVSARSPRNGLASSDRSPSTGKAGLVLASAKPGEPETRPGPAGRLTYSPVTVVAPVDLALVRRCLMRCRSRVSPVPPGPRSHPFAAFRKVVRREPQTKHESEVPKVLHSLPGAYPAEIGQGPMMRFLRARSAVRVHEPHRGFRRACAASRARSMRRSRPGLRRQARNCASWPSPPGASHGRTCCRETGKLPDPPVPRRAPVLWTA